MVGVNLRVESGQFIGIAGANGSGKSTLARIMNGLVSPTTGTVRLDGRPAEDAAALWALKKRIGLVFQNPDNQFVGYTVEDDVAFGPENFGVAPTEIDRRINEALELVGMGHVRMQPPSSLSGGEKQLVTLAAVLAQKPACIILDEATSMLDPGGRRLVLGALHRLVRDHGLAAVLISHDTEQMIAADRLVALQGGQIVFEGEPDELWRDEDMVLRLGMESPAAVRMSGELRRRGVTKVGHCQRINELVDMLCPSS